jgi:hypothetical protein
MNSILPLITGLFGIKQDHPSCGPWQMQDSSSLSSESGNLDIKEEQFAD